MFIEIQQLKQSGLNKSQVARHLNLNWKTVDKYWGMDADGFAQTVDQAGNRRRRLDKYEGVISAWLRKFPDMTAAQVEDWLEETYPDQEFREVNTFPDIP